MEILDENTVFGEWANAWAKRKVLGMNYKYVQSIHSFINHFEVINNQPIKKIRAIDIEDIILNLSVYNPTTKKPSSRKLLKNIRQTAVAIFSFAINNCDNLYRNPAKLVHIPQSSVKTERQALSMAEQMIIIETPHRARLASLIMMLCGLRVGELIALKWDNIDFDKHIIRVCQSAYNINGNQLSIKQGTKNGKSRNITIPNILYNLLLSEFLAKSGITDYVTTKSDGVNMHTRSSWERIWKSYTQELNINFTAHQLRHTYATMLYLSGDDVKSASELLGHSNIEITMNVYTHLMNETKVISISKFDKFLSNNFVTIS